MAKTILVDKHPRNPKGQSRVRRTNRNHFNDSPSSTKYSPTMKDIVTRKGKYKVHSNLTPQEIQELKVYNAKRKKTLAKRNASKLKSKAST